MQERLPARTENDDEEEEEDANPSNQCKKQK